MVDKEGLAPYKEAFLSLMQKEPLDPNNLCHLYSHQDAGYSTDYVLWVFLKA